MKDMVVRKSNILFYSDIARAKIGGMGVIGWLEGCYDLASSHKTAGKMVTGVRKNVARF